LNVSGSQTLDGVTFANGGIQSPGTISATSFVGDGSGLTNLSGGSIKAAGVVGSVQFHGDDGNFAGSNEIMWNHTAKNLAVSGSIQVVGTGAETCGVGDYGKLRTVDLGGGDVRIQICRP
jgi:hypothetical protein